MGYDPVIIDPKNEGSDPSTRNLPRNKTLFVGMLTPNGADEPETVEGLKTIEHVFKHFSPSLEVEMKSEDGSEQTEIIKYQNMADFTPLGVLKQSQILQKQQTACDFYNDMNRQVRGNDKLKRIVSDEGLRANFVSIIDQMLSML